MTGPELAEAREQASWPQAKLAGRLRVSQAYVSMLERGERPFTPALQKRLLALLEFSPLSFPLRGEDHWHELDDATLAHQLAGLGYPGFAHLRREPKWNPAELLVAALNTPSLEARAAEALPWLVLHFWNMKWDWVVGQAKLRNVQNRLGFTVALARELAEKAERHKVAERLRKVEAELKRSLLASENTFCNDDMTQAERRWLRVHRTRQAAEWNLLTNVQTEHLSHAL